MTTEQPSSNGIVARLTGRSGPMEDPDLCADALAEIGRLQRELEGQQTAVLQLEEAIRLGQTPAHLREPPHCKNCSCGMEE